MKGGGYGILVDVTLGILGGFSRRMDLRHAGNLTGGSMIGSIIVAFCCSGDFGLDYSPAQKTWKGSSCDWQPGTNSLLRLEIRIGTKRGGCKF